MLPPNQPNIPKLVPNFKLEKENIVAFETGKMTASSSRKLGEFNLYECARSKIPSSCYDITSPCLQAYANLAGECADETSPSGGSNWEAIKSIADWGRCVENKKSSLGPECVSVIDSFEQRCRLTDDYFQQCRNTRNQLQMQLENEIKSASIQANTFTKNHTIRLPPKDVDPDRIVDININDSSTYNRYKKYIFTQK
jgi:hypothetical protein